MHDLRDALLFAIGTIFVKYIVVQWCADQFGRLMHWLLVKTERDIIIWTHYQKHVMRDGHQAKTPTTCQDNGCRRFPLG